MTQPPDHRRQFLTFVLLLGFFLLWMNVAPRMFPGLFPKPNAKAPAPVPAAEGPEPPAVADAAANDAAPQPATPPAADEPPADPEPEAQLATFPRRTFILGDPAQGDLQRLQITSAGAAIEWQELTEQDFQTLDRKRQVRLLGNGDTGQLYTLAVRSPAFDIPLREHRQRLMTVDWELVEAESQRIPNSEAWRTLTFRYPSPDGAWEAVKSFTLHSGKGIDPKEDPSGYLVDVSLQFRRLAEGAGELSYALQGPVGLPLENADNTRTFRNVKGGTLEGSSDDSVSLVSLPAATLVKEINESIENNEPGQRPIWRYPIRWAGIDVQYFAALLIPQESQLRDANKDGEPEPYFAEVVPTVTIETDPVEQSDVSIVFESRKLTAGGDAADSITHKFQLYLGPKRVELLEKFHAQQIMDFGWFAPISKLMVALLNFFHHSLWLPYGLAIVLLTVIVRGCMFPISKKQVASVQKMKELNPKLQEIRTKYANDKEAMGRAQLELMRKHGYNPLAGCLPMFLQLPIFIGLYNGLNAAIDLRLAKFLWINNLAAPDALFHFPGRLPLLGWTEFNLLPLLTIVLFIIQNKLFTPPPSSDEQAMQYKMMNFMMVAMGFLFYRVPAGLCVYFIASSMWGICERKLLDRHKRALEAAAAAGAPAAATPPKPADEKPREPGFIARLLAAADDAKHATNAQSSSGRPDRSRKGSKSRR